MPTTSYTTPTASASVLGARTDAAGSAVTDWTAEEARLLGSTLTAGYLTPSNAFVVAPQAVPNMSVKVGSGTAKADHYIVAGSVAGQGNYLIRLDVVSQNVTIAPADASQARTDEIYLVVRDNAYDSSARALPQIGYRQGDLGGAAPGPDAAWRASVLLARVTVAANATSVTAANITDQRAPGGFAPALLSGQLPKSLVVAKGDLLVGLSSGVAQRLPAGPDGAALRAASGQTLGLEWSGVGQAVGKYASAVGITSSLADVPASPSGTIVFPGLVAGAAYRLDVRGGLFNPAGGTLTGVRCYIGASVGTGGYAFAEGVTHLLNAEFGIDVLGGNHAEVDVSALITVPGGGGLVGFQMRTQGATSATVALTALLTRIA